MEHDGTGSIRDKLELHKRWLNERLHNDTSDTHEDEAESHQIQQTGSFRGHRRDVSEPPLRNGQLFINEYPEDEEETKQDFRRTPDTYINNRSFVVQENHRENINDKSHDRCHDRSMDNLKKPKRWEALYNLNKKNLQMKEQISREIENKELDIECTFQPRTRNTHQNSSPMNPLSIHERNKLWKERREAKLALTRESGKDKDLEQCTFKPHVSPRKRNESFGGMTSYQTRGIEKYLRRQVVARKSKEEKEKILENPLSRLPENVLRKEGKVTIPRGPKFVENTKAFDISSLKKPLNPPHLATNKHGKSSYQGSVYSKRNSITPLGEKNRNTYGEESYWYENEEYSRNHNEYSQVLQSLHDELHNFELKYE